MGVGTRQTRGQMTVELAVCIPVLIAVALVVCNALLFMENCAAFDRHARDAVRVCAASPAHGQTAAEGAALMQARLAQAFSQDYLSVSVSVSGAPPGFVTYCATLHFTPTLFGRSFSGAVYGLVCGSLEHTTSLTIDPYRPGVVV